MKPKEDVQNDLGWERDVAGHLTDAAIAALADGQDVSAQAAGHAEVCEACSGRLADAALGGAELHREIRALAEEPELHREIRALAEEPERAPAAIERSRRPARAAQRGPALYIAAAVAVGVLASLPTVTALPSQAAGLAGAIKLQVSGFKQVGRAVFLEISAPVWSLVLAGVFVALGVVIAVWGSSERRNNHGFA